MKDAVERVMTGKRNYCADVWNGNISNIMWRFDGDTETDRATGPPRTGPLSHVTSGLHFADFKKTRIEFSIEIDF